MKLFDTLKSIDKKTYLYIGIAIVVIVAVILIIRKVTKKSDSEKGLDEIGKNVEKTNLSYETSQYATFADSLESNLSDKGITAGLMGVNQKGVYEVFRKMQNEDDVKQLIVAFGTRQFRKAYTFGVYDCTLSQALSLLMTTGEIKEINEILKDNNINYQF